MTISAVRYSVALIILSGSMTWFLADNAHGDQISFDGRTEPAECHVEAGDPPIQLCESESWICRIQGGDVNCEVKR